MCVGPHISTEDSLKELLNQKFACPDCPEEVLLATGCIIRHYNYHHAIDLGGWKGALSRPALELNRNQVLVFDTVRRYICLRVRLSRERRHRVDVEYAITYIFASLCT